jgi:alkyl hydroperoxide reductase subunit AhpC
MDPTANVSEQARLSEEILQLSDKLHCDVGPDAEASDARTYAEIGTKAVRLAELVQALDTWIKRGGALPAQWRK